MTGKLCACGCERAVQGNSTWAPGCDSKALHERIKEGWGSTEAFVNWYDTVTHVPKLGESRVPTRLHRRPVIAEESEPELWRKNVGH